MVAKQSLYETGMRTVLVAKYGSNLEPESVGELVSNIDIAPSILHAANIPIPNWMEGASWWPLVVSGDNAGPRSSSPCLISEINSDRAVVAKDASSGKVWKMIRKDASSATQKRTARFYPAYGDLTQMYDLSSDPAEAKNLASTSAHGDILKTLSSYLDCHDNDTVVGSSKNVVGSICDVRSMAKLGSDDPVKPTEKPTANPTTKVTAKPTAKVTAKPTAKATAEPTAKFTESPTRRNGAATIFSLSAFVATMPLGLAHALIF